MLRLVHVLAVTLVIALSSVQAAAAKVLVRGQPSARPVLPYEMRGDAASTQLEMVGPDSRVTTVTSLNDDLSGEEFCRNTAARTVRCEGVSSWSVFLHEGDDDVRAAFATTSAYFDLGTGNDRAIAAASQAAMRFVGGAGQDVLVGGRGDDSFYQDVADGGDSIDGGPGFDGVIYDAATRVDLRAGRAGGPAGDLLESIESASTGGGDDVLIGNNRPNHLFAGLGENRLEGHGGADQIYVGAHDTVLAGAGNDIISESNPRRTYLRTGSIDCGPGHDLLEPQGILRAPVRSCERLTLGVAVLDTAALRSHHPHVKLICDPDYGTCRVHLRLKHGRHSAVVHGRARPGRSPSIPVPADSADHKRISLFASVSIQGTRRAYVTHGRWTLLR
jgi:hypothetical protein